MIFKYTLHFNVMMCAYFKALFVHLISWVNICVQSRPVSTLWRFLKHNLRGGWDLSCHIKYQLNIAPATPSVTHTHKVKPELPLFIFQRGCREPDHTWTYNNIFSLYNLTDLHSGCRREPLSVWSGAPTSVVQGRQGASSLWGRCCVPEASAHYTPAFLV